MDQRKREIRQTIAAKMQEIRNLQGIIEELHAGIDHSFVKLENKLKNHPENPVAVVQGHMKYFNEVSQQISELYKRIAVLRSEMDKMQQMVTPVQKNQEKKIGSEVNMEKFSILRRQRNTFTTAVKFNLSVHANLEGDGHGRYTYTSSQVPASSRQSDAARTLVNPAVINPVSGIPLSSNRYSVLEYTDNIVDADKSDADVICNEYFNENFPVKRNRVRQGLRGKQIYQILILQYCRNLVLWFKQKFRDPQSETLSEDLRLQMMHRNQKNLHRKVQRKEKSKSLVRKREYLLPLIQ